MRESAGIENSDDDGASMVVLAARTDSAEVEFAHLGRDAGDLARAIESNAQGLWRFLLVRVGGDEDLAEELMQEACLQSARAKQLPDVNPERFKYWLFGVVRNVLRRHWRTTARRRKSIPVVRADLAGQLAEMIDSSPLPEEIIESSEAQQQVMFAITALPGMVQEMILRHYFDGQSQAEIANDMNLTVRSVEGHLYRARQALRGKLAHLEEDTDEP